MLNWNILLADITGIRFTDLPTFVITAAKIISNDIDAINRELSKTVNNIDSLEINKIYTLGRVDNEHVAAIFNYIPLSIEKDGLCEVSIDILPLIAKIQKLLEAGDKKYKYKKPEQPKAKNIKLTETSTFYEIFIREVNKSLKEKTEYIGTIVEYNPDLEKELQQFVPTMISTPPKDAYQNKPIISPTIDTKAKIQG